jgi:hypothetical protein
MSRQPLKTINKYRGKATEELHKANNKIKTRHAILLHSYSYHCNLFVMYKNKFHQRFAARCGTTKTFMPIENFISLSSG